ncbi:MAG TPA: hypothetical protein VHY35_25055 [Stellaceae bacterium]|jgi:hypothetical protein|nr:hypothetical protein [Stellaceae bacterium]
MIYGVSLTPGLTQVGEITISPWLEDLIREYQQEISAPSRPGRLILLASMLAILSPFLLRLDRAAYPSEPDKQQALELCGRADPTFVRFFASERDACYARVINRAARAAADTEQRR